MKSAVFYVWCALCCLCGLFTMNGCVETPEYDDAFDAYMAFLSQNEVCAEIFAAHLVGKDSASSDVYYTCLESALSYMNEMNESKKIWDVAALKQALVKSSWQGSGSRAGTIGVWNEDGSYVLKRQLSNGRIETLDAGRYEISIAERVNRPLLTLFHADDDVEWPVYFSLENDELRLFEPTDDAPYMLYIRE